MRVSIACILIFPALSFAQDTQTPTDARGWINQGVQAYKSQQYDRAIEAFQKAIDLEPGNVNAHLYLATALTGFYVLGTPQDITARAERAKSEFMRVLELDSTNMTALESLAKSSLNGALVAQDQGARLRKLDDARDWFQRILSVDGRNRDAYYSLGVIDWRKWHPNLIAARAQIGMKPEDPGPISDTGMRGDLKLLYGSIIEDGIANLKKALQIDPFYGEAMTTLNLFIRERADIRDSPEEYRRDMEEAEQWLKKAAAANERNSAPVAPASPASRIGVAPERVRVSADVQSRSLLERVAPLYPQLALAARVQGTVRFTRDHRQRWPHRKHSTDRRSSTVGSGRADCGSPMALSAGVY